jgi:glucokinase
MKRFIGIDIGGTRIKAGLVDSQHRITNEHVAWLTEADKTEEGIIDKLKKVVHTAQGEQSVVAVGIGVPGIVSSRDGTVKSSPNFPAWRDFNVKARLKKVLRMPVLIDNDANCVLTGEYLTGVAAGKPHFVGLTLGTGIGGALFIDGRVWRGEVGMAGELGHINVVPDGFQCGCGSQGCVEQYASVVGFRNLCREQPVEAIDPEAKDLPQLLCRAAEGGDVTAIGHFATGGTMLGRAVANVVNAMDIRTVVLAGGVSAAFDWMKETFHHELTARSYSTRTEPVEVLLASQGHKAGIVGAAMQWKVQA